MDLDLSPELLHSILTIVPIFLFSLCAHEYAHAWMATRLGDLSPTRDGRLSLDPMAHLDPVGTVLFPALCLYFHWAFFGWAKPVPVSAANLKYHRRGVAIVAISGPVANFILALVLTGGLAWVIRIPSEHSVLATITELMQTGIKINLMLAFLNLIPIPALDGYTVLRALAPARFQGKLQIADRNADLFLLLIMVCGGLNAVDRPVSHFHVWLMQMAGA